MKYLEKIHRNGVLGVSAQYGKFGITLESYGANRNHWRITINEVDSSGKNLSNLFRFGGSGDKDAEFERFEQICRSLNNDGHMPQVKIIYDENAPKEEGK